MLADSEGPDQTARMRSLIRAFAVFISPKTRFRMGFDPNDPLHVFLTDLRQHLYLSL